MNLLKIRRLHHTVRTEAPGSRRTIQCSSPLPCSDRGELPGHTREQTNPTDLESHNCDKMAPFTLTQEEQERFSTETVDNFVDNLVLSTGDAVQSRV